MKLLSRLTLMGSASVLVVLTAPPSIATVLSGLGTPAGAAQIYSPQPLVLASVSQSTPQYSLPLFISPASVPSSQPSSGEYDFVSNPEIVAPSVFSQPVDLTLYTVPSVMYATPPSPVSLLYTGPQAASFGPGGVPILFNTPSALPLSLSVTSVAGLFSASDPVTNSPQVTAAVANFAPKAVPEFSPVPEPRFESAIVLAAALALMGILAARRRRKEA